MYTTQNNTHHFNLSAINLAVARLWLFCTNSIFTAFLKLKLFLYYNISDIYIILYNT